MKKKQKKIGKPLALLYHPAFLLVSLYYRLRYRVHIDNSDLDPEAGAAIVLATHTSNKDHFLTAMALYPRRVTFVMSQHFFEKKALRPILRLMHAIPKKMFCSDGASVLSMIRAIREGNTLVLFPEGRLTCNGKSCPITPGTADLVRKLGVPVYTITAEGAGKTFPKWAKKPRIGRIDVRLRKLFEGSELKNMEPFEVEEKIAAAIEHNAWESLPNVNFRSRKPAVGLDTILWRCPRCGAEHTLICKKNTITCAHCSLEATVDCHGQIKGVRGITNIYDWYEHNAKTLNLNLPLECACSVRIATINPIKKQALKERRKNGAKITNTGEGKFTLSREGIVFSGIVNGLGDRFSLLGKDCPGALPITPGDHFDVYSDNVLYFITPEPDPRDAVKFVAYMDKMHGN